MSRTNQFDGLPADDEDHNESVSHLRARNPAQQITYDDDEELVSNRTNQTQQTNNTAKSNGTLKSGTAKTGKSQPSNGSDKNSEKYRQTEKFATEQQQQLQLRKENFDAIPGTPPPDHHAATPPPQLSDPFELETTQQPKFGNGSNVGSAKHDAPHDAFGDEESAGGGRRGGGGASTDDGNSGRLYDLLQAEPDVPASEIKRVFEKTELRAQYREAYRILSNSDKKRVYDIVGEPIVDTLNKSWGDVVEVLGSTVTSIVYGLAWVAVSVLLILFFIFLPIHIDQWYTDFSWHGVHTPLYILFCLAVAGSIFLCMLSLIAPSKTSTLAFRHPLGRLLVAIGYLVFTFLVGSALNDDKDPKWMGYFVILIVVDCVTVIEWMTWAYPRKVRRLIHAYNVDASSSGMLMNKSANLNVSSKNPAGREAVPENARTQGKATEGFYYNSLVYGFMVIGVIDFALVIIRYVLIGLRCDQTITSSWYGILTPVALRFVSAIAFKWQTGRVQQYIDQRSNCMMYLSMLGTFFLNACLITTTYMIAGFLENEGDYELIFAFIPVYFILAYFLFASIFTFFYLIKKNRDFIALEEHEATQLQLRHGEGRFGKSRSNRKPGDSDDEEAEETDEAAETEEGESLERNNKANNRTNKNRAGEVLAAGDTDEEGSSDGEEVCISEATRESEEDHHPFGRNNTSSVTGNTGPRTRK